MRQMADKPYEFVSFPPGSPHREKPEGHQHFAEGQLSGTLILTLTVRRPVQVASGFLDVVRTKGGEEVVARDTTIRKSVHILPGSSLKGTVRSLVEALSSSCIRVTSWRSRSALPRQLNACSRAGDLCPACRLFGMSGRARENYAGQVHCEDALMVDGRVVIVRTPLLWTPVRSRRGLPRRYLEGQEAKGRKLYYHGTLARGPDTRLVAGTGSTFETRFHFENLSGAELGLLLAALGLHPDRPFLLKVGAGKPVGMGSVDVQLKKVVLLGDISRSGRAGAGTKQLTGEALTSQVKAWIDDADAKDAEMLNREALEDVWSILREENLSRPSPDESY